jgi:hypothetical protein
MSFSQEQRVFIVENYFASRSYVRVVDEFRRKYPDAAVPNNFDHNENNRPFSGMWISCRQEEIREAGHHE